MGKKQKDPISGFQEGSCCPKCGSTKVVCWIQFPLVAKFDMKGKEIIEDLKGNRVYRPSNQILAARYRHALGTEFECASYECKKCGWASETYVP